MNKRMSGALKCAMVVWIATLWMGCAFGWALREGDAYAARGQWQQALDAYERALALDPDSRAAQALVEQARRALALDALEQAREAKAAERWSEAVMVLRNAQKLDPTNVEVMALLNDTRDLMLD
ncbi:MAG: tetratricopeptide repeat protein, partial [Myxococcota bacterium]